MEGDQTIYETLYICDPDVVYAKRLEGYLNRKAAFTYPVRAFFGLDAFADHLKAAVKEKRPLTALISEGAYGQIGAYDAFSGRDIRWVVLAENPGSVPGAIRVDKYQSAGKLCGRLMDLLKPGENGAGAAVTGIYPLTSPRRAMDWARNYFGQDDRKRRLWIVLEELADLDWMADHTGMSEIFYRIPREDGEAMEAVSLSDHIVSGEYADRLPGFMTAYDMTETTPAQWTLFFREILGKSGYEEIFLVFQRLPLYPEIFRFLDRMIVFSGTDRDSKEQTRRFRQLIRYIGLDGLEEKIAWQTGNGQEMQ